MINKTVMGILRVKLLCTFKIIFHDKSIEIELLEKAYAYE